MFMTKRRTISLVALALTILVAGAVVWRVVSETRKLIAATGPYGDDSDRTLKQISSSVKLARAGNKEVILEFGANSCTWCKLVEKVFESDKRVAEELQSHYIVVLVDISGRNNQRVNAKYGDPTHDGVPVAVFLDSNGKQLLTKNIAFADQAALSNGVPRGDADKLLDFLKKRAEQRLSAR